MCLWQRYLFGSVLLVSSMAVGMCVLLVLTGNLLKDLMANLDVTVLTAVELGRLLALALPFALSYGLPFGLLIGVLLTMGRLSSQNELTSLKSSGLSLWRLATPILLLALLGSLVATAINTSYASARERYKVTLEEIVLTDPARFIRPRTFIEQFPGFILYIGGIESGRLQQFWLWELNDTQEVIRLLRAREGYLRYDRQRDALILTLVEGFTEIRDTREPDDVQTVRPVLTFQETSLRLSLGTQRGPPRVKVAHLNFPQVLERARHYSARAEAAPSASARVQAAKEATYARYHANRQVALGFSVLSLGFLAIPLGLKVGRKETLANFALALAISMAFYLGMTGVDWVSREPRWRPEVLVWLPNLCCQALALVLMRRANRT